MNENYCEWINLILNTRKFLECFLSNHHNLFYTLLCIIVFCETGLVATPFLPGDSLLFTAGLLAAAPANNLNVGVMIGLVFLSAILGDNVNYFIGRKLGIKIFEIKFLSKIVKREYLTKTEKFFEQHGGKTIIMARFVPIVRTFAPFTAGLGSMSYRKYILFCLAGAVLWVPTLTLAGYFLGTNEWVNKNLEKVILGIIFISVLPVIIGALKARFAKKSSVS